MGPELVALASTAASMLVTAMTTEAWKGVRTRLAKLLSRGDPPTEIAIADLLEEDVALVASGEVATLEDVRSQWTVRLRDLLRGDPDAATALRELMAELSHPAHSTSR